MNILFVGNSYTYFNDMPVLFERLARENGKDAAVFSVTKGGRKLLQYADADETTAALDSLLSQRTYDVCILQEQSVLPIKDPHAFHAGLTLVTEKLAGLAGRLVLYATWGRKEGSKTLSELSLTTERMACALDSAYRSAAERFGAEVSPVGMRFLDVSRTYPEIELYNPDLSHPSYTGSCLSALTHYQTIFRELPEQMNSLDLGEDVCAAFRASLAGQPCISAAKGI